MSVLYVKEQGASIRRSGETLEVIKQNQRLLSFPIGNLDSVSIFGNVQISTQALVCLMERGIDVSLFSRSGKLIGQALSDTSKNIFLRFAQYEAYQDLDARMEMARILVRNKIENQQKLVRQYRYVDGFAPKQELRKMQELKERLEGCRTANEILGIEGMCSNLYFSCFAHMVSGNCKFEGRNRRPPKDPVNVLLSLGYTFLTKEVCAALEAESFEVYLGFLHGIRYGRKSLALDIVEEFRQPVVDRFVIRSFNKRIINEFDFETDDGRILLSEEGFKKFCQEFEEWITGRKSIQPEDFRKRIREQSAGLKKALQTKTAYVPYCWEKDNGLCDQL